MRMRKRMGYGFVFLLFAFVSSIAFSLVSQSASQGERPRGMEDVTWTWQLVQSGIFWPEDDPTFPIAVTFDQEFQGTALYDWDRGIFIHAEAPLETGPVRRINTLGPSGLRCQYFTPTLRAKIVQDGKAVEFYCSRTITGTLEQSGKDYDFGSLGGSEPVFVVTADEMEEGIK